MVLAGIGTSSLQLWQLSGVSRLSVFDVMRLIE